MRPQRLFDHHKQFYALVPFKYAGVKYKRGDKFDIGEMSSRQPAQFFQNNYIGYAEDFRYGKTNMKEVELEGSSKETSEKEEEEVPKKKKKQSKKKVKTEDE